MLAGVIKDPPQSSKEIILSEFESELEPKLCPPMNSWIVIILNHPWAISPNVSPDPLAMNDILSSQDLSRVGLHLKH